MGAHTVVSSILIRRLHVGMLDVWVNVLHLAQTVVSHPVLVVVLIIQVKIQEIIELEKAEDALTDVQLTVSVYVKEFV